MEEFQIADFFVIVTSLTLSHCQHWRKVYVNWKSTDSGFIYDLDQWLESFTLTSNLYGIQILGLPRAFWKYYKLVTTKWALFSSNLNIHICIPNGLWSICLCIIMRKNGYVFLIKRSVKVKSVQIRRIFFFWGLTSKNGNHHSCHFFTS